jgi:hypothetical protein
MDFIAVTSSNIQAYAVDGSTLYLQFKGGETYAYHLLPDTVTQGFADASSKGEFFHGQIRPFYKGIK